MNTVTEIINDTRRKLIVSIPKEKIETEEKDLLKVFIKDGRIPGFRPGKAPVHLIKKHYQKTLGDELKRRMVGQAYRSATENTDFDIYSLVEVEDKTLTTEDEPKVTFIVDIIPEFELPDYKGIILEPFDSEVKDTEVDNILDMLRRQYADFRDKEGIVAAGDYVQLSYEGKIGEQAIVELVPDKPIWGKQQHTWEEAGSFKEDQPMDQQWGVAAVVNGVIGMKAGGEKIAEQVFPEDFPIEALAGKTAVYSINIHSVRERVLPEWNDDLLKKVNVESVEQLREQITNNLKNRKESQKNNQYQSQVLEALKKEVDFPVPDNALEDAAQSLLIETTRENLKRGVSEEEIEKHSEEIINDSQKGASDRIRLRYLLLRIAQKESIKAAQEDLVQYIASEAAMKKVSQEKLGKDLAKDQQRLSNISESIVLNKTINFIISQAKVTVGETSAEASDSSSKTDESENKVDPIEEK